MIPQKKRRPLIEHIDVRVNGSTPVDIELKEPFVKISRLIVTYEWAITPPVFNYDLFCDQPALTNGIRLIQNKQDIFPVGLPIINHLSHARLAYDTGFNVDTLGVIKHVHFFSRLSFHKFMGNEEGINPVDFPVIVKVQDDLSGIGIELTWIFQGWTWDR